MDRLQECAKAFEKLFDVQYHIIIGRKGKTVDLRIGFEPVDFHHLLGLHKLRDLRLSRGNREQVYYDALAGKIQMAQIASSHFFPVVQNRVSPFNDIERLFDMNNLVFRYNAKQHIFSLIQADYLLSTPYENTDIYIFLDKRDGTDIYFCRSFFPKEDKDYTTGQAAYTMLFKEKITMSTGEKLAQYDRLSPLNPK